MKNSAFLITIMLFLLIMISCQEAVDPFLEYRGVNLNTVRTLADWAPDSNTTYMNYEDVTGTYSPPAEAPGTYVYRFEIKNLIPNGDFDGSPVGPAPTGWSLFAGGGAADTLEVVGEVNPRSINGNTVYFKTDDIADRIDFEITAGSTGASDGFIQDSTYLIRFDYRTGSALTFEFNDNIESLSRWKIFGGIDGSASGTSFDNIIGFPPVYLIGEYPEKTAGSAAHYDYTFGSLASEYSQIQEGYIDNFRLIKTDIPLRTRLTFKQTGDTLEPLISGIYRFSVYIKLDSSAGSGNRFSTEKVTLGITGGNLESEDPGENYYSISQCFTDGEDGDWADWAEIHTDLFIQIPEDTEDADVLELSICPSDDTRGAPGIDTGSILIAYPKLELLPDGPDE